MTGRLVVEANLGLLFFFIIVSLTQASRLSSYLVSDGAQGLRKQNPAAELDVNRQSEDDSQPLSCTINFQGAEREFESCQSLALAELNLFWTFDADAGEIQTAFQTRLDSGIGYVAFAYGYTEMIASGGSITIIAYLKQDGDAAAEEYVMTSKSSSGVQPQSGQNLSTTIEADVDDSFLTGYFVRPLTGTDLPDVEQGRTSFIWAKGATPQANDNLAKHTTRGFGDIDLSSTAGTEGTAGTGSVQESVGSGFGDFFIVHGVFMAVAWALIGPLGILVARFLKSKDPLWFQLHRGIMLFVLTLVIVAYVMGVARGSHEGTKTKVHLALGTVALAGALIQALGGLFRPAKESLLRPKWRLAHLLSGRFIVLLAFANSILGLVIFDVSSGYYIAVSVVFGALVLTGLSMEAAHRYKKLKHKPNQVPDVDDAA